MQGCLCIYWLNYYRHKQKSAFCPQMKGLLKIRPLNADWSDALHRIYHYKLVGTFALTVWF